MANISRIDHQIFLASAGPLDFIDAWQAPQSPIPLLDWSYLFHLAKQHRTVPLLQHFLKRHFRTNVPSETINQIDQFVHQQTLSNILQVRELLQVLENLHSQHIEAIPFKGPALGALLYNQLSYRPFGDLDLLIHKKDFYKVKELLINMGYSPFRKFSPQKEARFLETQMGYEFIGNDRRSVIEIHWSLLNRIHAFHIPEDELWASRKTVELQNKLVQRFDDKHLFIYLCAHGTQSLWTRLRWVTDLAELISKKSKEPEAEAWWSSVQTMATAYNALRMVHLGVFLAHKLLHAPVPRLILEAARADDKVQALYNRVEEALFAPTDQKLKILRPLSFHLHMRERLKDKQPYLMHMIQLWLQPGKKDMALIKLPAPLHFLYFLIKPFRILSQRFLKAFV